MNGGLSAMPDARRRMAVAAALLLALISGQANSQTNGRVQAEDYRQFWLWSGVRPPPLLDSAARVYVFQGEFYQQQGQRGFRPLGPAPAQFPPPPQIWLTLRTDTLSWSVTDTDSLLQLIGQWQFRGTPIQGVQIDLDARTYALLAYADFLRQLRGELPAEYALGITGLMDWASTGSVQVLNDLLGVVDEIVVQTYQGRHTVPNYADYLPALQRLRLPFSVGLIQHGVWDTQWQQRLSANPAYLGEVVFLVDGPGLP